MKVKQIIDTMPSAKVPSDMSEKQDAARLLGALGGKETARRMTPEQRVARGAAAARARWAKLLTTEEPETQERQNQQDELK